MGNYKKYAEMELESCKILHKAGMYNKAAKDGISYIEKILKDYLEDNNKLSLELSRTHNIKKLFRAVSDDKTLYKKIASISGYYFETVYPGDDSIDLDKEDVEDVLDVCEDVKIFIESSSKTV